MELKTAIYLVQASLLNVKEDRYIHEAKTVMTGIGFKHIGSGAYCSAYSMDGFEYVFKVPRQTHHKFSPDYTAKNKSGFKYLIPEFMSENRLLAVQKKAIIQNNVINEIDKCKASIAKEKNSEKLRDLAHKLENLVVARISMDNFSNDRRIKKADGHGGNIGFINGEAYNIDLDNQF